jgi:hypothetical protein
MEQTASFLPPIEKSSSAPVSELHLLTGNRFWYQTLFCLWSFSRRLGSPVSAIIYDDGTLTPEIQLKISTILPYTRFVSIAETRTRLDLLLPEANFPSLRERWLNYPNIRKLIDVHLGSTGWKLVIDSDLLFFRRPTFLIDWLDHPQELLHAVDCTESYGYSRALMESLSGKPIPPLVNVGLCGINSSSLDWDELEHWCATLITREKTNYYLEQALVAMLASRTACAVAPAVDYVTLPSKSEALHPTAVMHHYVDTAKRWYFTHCWRLAQNLPSAR